MTTPPCMFVAFLTLLAAAIVGGSAVAQDVSPTVQALRSCRRARACIGAASAIGRTRPQGGREALEAALDNHNPRVRAAVVGALAALGDARAVTALQARGHDRDRHVREAVFSAVRELSPGESPGTAVSVDDLTAPTDATVNWRHVRYVMGVGPVVNQAREAAGFVPVVRAAMEQELRGRPELAPRPEDLPAGLAARIRRGAVHAFSLEGGVTSLRAVELPAAAAVRAEVSLLLMSEPTHTMVGAITGAATAQVPLMPGATMPTDDGLRTHAIQAAVRSALAHIERELATMHPR